MRRTLLLALVIASSACLGSECSGGGSSGGGSAAANRDTIETPGPGDGPVSPMPEPSAGLVFGAGLLVAYAATRRRKK